MPMRSASPTQERLPHDVQRPQHRRSPRAGNRSPRPWCSSTRRQRPEAGPRGQQRVECRWWRRATSRPAPPPRRHRAPRRFRRSGRPARRQGARRHATTAGLEGDRSPARPSTPASRSSPRMFGTSTRAGAAPRRSRGTERAVRVDVKPEPVPDRHAQAGDHVDVIVDDRSQSTPTTATTPAWMRPASLMHDVQVCRSRPTASPRPPRADSARAAATSDDGTQGAVDARRRPAKAASSPGRPRGRRPRQLWFAVRPAGAVAQDAPTSPRPLSVLLDGRPAAGDEAHRPTQGQDLPCERGEKQTT